MKLLEATGLMRAIPLQYILYFAYALSMKDLIHQLEEIGRLAQGSFGVLGGNVEQFEAQFRYGVGADGPQ
jgi:hypothetical protein